VSGFESVNNEAEHNQKDNPECQPHHYFPVIRVHRNNNLPWLLFALDVLVNHVLRLLHCQEINQEAIVEITLNINSLSKAQREHVAGFILTFPEDAAEATDKIWVTQKVDKAAEQTKPDPLGNLPRGPEPIEIELDPNTVFSTTADLATFGATVNIPPPPPAPPALPLSAAFGPGPQLVPAPPASALDSAGFPWDNRIHSSSHSQNSNGTWRALRGVLPQVVAEVEAELRQKHGIMSKADKQAPPPPAAPVPIAASVVQNAPPTGPIVSAAVPPSDITFPAFVAKLSAAIQNNKLTEAEFTQTCAFAGVGNLTLLGQRLDLLPEVNAQIDKIIERRG
jgi:hypothetical protein